MRQKLYGSAVLTMLLMILTAALPDRTLSQSLSDDTDSIIAPPTQADGRLDEPICYMKTTSGQMINLRSICEDYSNQRTFGNNSQFQRQRSLDNIRVRSRRALRSNVGYAEDSSDIDDR
jgi:hypothetical protein